MEIVEVEYSELLSEGFNNRKVGVRATVNENETPQAVLDKLKQWVSEQIGRKEFFLTHYQKVQIAKEIILEIERNEIPY